MKKPTLEKPPPGRLRAAPRIAPFHIVLVEPEIPPNTGNIARLCAAAACPLHLVGHLGFDIDAQAVRRAGLDYWHLVDVQTHPNLVTAEKSIAQGQPDRSGRSWLFSGKATRSFLDVEYQLGDLLVFGKESVGLDQQLLAERPEQVVGIPTLGAVRSLNLSNSAALAVYEALRQTGCLEVDAARSELGT